jgi:6-phosphogluconolactonase (cycloisomerase 2 family)
MATVLSHPKRAHNLGLTAVSVGLALAAGIVPVAHGQADNRAIFVANNGNLEGSVTAFEVHDDGTLAFVNKVITGSRPNMNSPCPGCNPYEISIAPDGRFLVTGHASTNDPYEQVSFFEVAASGSITEIAYFSIPGTPMDVAWITDELLAVTRVDSNQVVVYRFLPGSPPTLSQIDVKSVGTFSTYLVVHPSRQYLYVNDSGGGRQIFVFSVNANGTLTLLQQQSTGSNYALELALTHDGRRLYAAGGITHVILGFSVSAGGTLSPLGGSPFPEFGSSPSNVATSTSDDYLLAGHGTDATVRSATIDPNTGGLTYTGNMFDVGMQGTLGDVQVLDDFFFVTDNSTLDGGVLGVYSFKLNADGSFTQNAPIYDTQGIGPRSIATWHPEIHLGDLNCDGAVDFDDINAFVLALSDPEGYAQAYPDCYIASADCNGDGLINFDDIDPFVSLLTEM